MILYCASGGRSALACKALQDLGYRFHDDYDAALGKVKRAMDFVHRRQKVTMDVVKRTAIEARKSRPQATADQ